MLRLVLGTAFALVLGTALALAAPGLSTHAFVPKVVEFELDGAAPPAGIAANSGFVSPPMQTPKRFNLVGLSWEGGADPAIAVRARKDGDDWTPWTPASGDGKHGQRESTSAPVWVGEADWIQYRMSRRVPGLELHFINTTGTATAQDRLLNGIRRAAHAAVVSIAPAWGATASQPRIHTRAEWGGDQCPTRGVHYGRVRAAVIHHTVTANAYTRDQVPAAILAICRFHRNTNGWNDIGYNFVVDRFGRIWEGRDGGIDEAVLGAHAQGYNSQTTGIANLGEFTETPQSEAAIAAMARLIAWKLPNHGVRTTGTVRLTSAGGASARYPHGYTRRFQHIIGHRDTGLTACPGEQLYFQLSDLRERVGESHPTGEKVLMTAELPDVATYSPDGLTFSGSLTDEFGAPVSGVPVELQRLRRTGWQPLDDPVTDTEGNFDATARFKRNKILRWEFAGDDTYRPFRGDGVVVTIAPEISLETSTTGAETGERVDLSGTITPSKATGLKLVIERDDDGHWHRIARKPVEADHGVFTKRPGFDEAGDYRLSVRFAGDDVNAAGTSPFVEVSVTDPLVPF